MATGPNPKLLKGPIGRNKQNKTQAKGPQKENVKGPIGKQIKTLKKQYSSDEE